MTHSSLYCQACGELGTAVSVVPAPVTVMTNERSQEYTLDAVYNISETNVRKLQKSKLKFSEVKNSMYDCLSVTLNSCLVSLHVTYVYVPVHCLCSE